MCCAASPDRRGHPPRIKVELVASRHLEGRSKELLEVAEKVPKTLRREVEEEGLKLSIKEGGRARFLRHTGTWKRSFRISAKGMERALQTVLKHWEWFSER